ncbi:hypothetical protein GGE45_002575 [Rhizobium aethiopicum]|uniref:TnsA endonuclease N terminal n=1 Tax=Rhizobium aethiopicum TaxID=1138170 RepID=A0A7W6MCI2_9HYPH|nr:hypothetical protein [Rhizobium aethiopicum]MBB4190016.1 hypothetical protein [Rhizobium aethiopicum]MBB4580245.1 hypothetical protein [Rhizobium aethiopicum]
MNPYNAKGRATRGAVCLASERFKPFGTVRCSNPPFFRCQLARDLGCILDVDDDVVAWCCRPHGMDAALDEIEWQGPPPDFMVTYPNGKELYLHAVEDVGDPEVTEAAACRKLWHRFVKATDIRVGYRLQNARDLLRYAAYQTPLGDRIRLLAALEHEGSATVAECLSIFREVSPIAGLSSLILNRVVTVDLDAELIAPHTPVRVFGI